MANAYTWDFPTVDTAPSEDGLSDVIKTIHWRITCLLYTSPSPRDRTRSRMPSSA